jgi:antiviral helicase SLH1
MNGRPQRSVQRQTDGLFGGVNVMDTIMDRETRHKRLLASANQHKELDKAKPQAAEYPHVYGAPTGGNILNAFGKKYALPLGTERHLEDVHAHRKCL